MQKCVKVLPQEKIKGTLRLDRISLNRWNVGVRYIRQIRHHMPSFLLNVSNLPNHAAKTCLVYGSSFDWMSFCTLHQWFLWLSSRFESCFAV